MQGQSSWVINPVSFHAGGVPPQENMYGYEYWVQLCRVRGLLLSRLSAAEWNYCLDVSRDDELREGNQRNWCEHHQHGYRGSVQGNSWWRPQRGRKLMCLQNAVFVPPRWDLFQWSVCRFGCVQGYLWKKGQLRRNWKERWFTLKPSNLSYYTGEDRKDCQGNIALDENCCVEVNSWRDNHLWQLEKLLITKSPQQKYSSRRLNDIQAVVLSVGRGLPQGATLRFFCSFIFYHAPHLWFNL